MLPEPISHQIYEYHEYIASNVPSDVLDYINLRTRIFGADDYPDNISREDLLPETEIGVFKLGDKVIGGYRRSVGVEGCPLPFEKKFSGVDIIIPQVWDKGYRYSEIGAVCAARETGVANLGTFIQQVAFERAREHGDDLVFMGLRDINVGPAVIAARETEFNGIVLPSQAVNIRNVVRTPAIFAVNDGLDLSEVIDTELAAISIGAYYIYRPNQRAETVQR